SRFGRKFSNFWVRYETERSISDSQSGLRIYPLFHLQNLRFRTRRYDFEIEVLIRLLWKGVKPREVEVEVHYPESSERVTHFRKGWDNLRISLLNTALVVVMLFQVKRPPSITAAAITVG